MGGDEHHSAVPKDAPTFANKAAMYASVLLSAEGLLPEATTGTAPASSNPNAIPPAAVLMTVLGNLSSVLFYSMNALVDVNAKVQQLPVNWVGFYLMTTPTKLTLGPFQGKLACTQISLGKGVCGTVALHGKAQCVRDVNAHPNHIACDSASVSEVVIPIRNANNKVVAVLDIDSTVLGQFTEEDDVVPLTKLCEMIGRRLEFVLYPAARPFGAADAPATARPAPFAAMHATQGTSTGAATTTSTTAAATTATGTGIPVTQAASTAAIAGSRPDVRTKMIQPWVFQTTALQRIANTNEANAIQAALGVSALPEIVFADNTLRFIHEPTKVELHVSAQEVLRSAAAFYRTEDYRRVRDAMAIAAPASWEAKRAQHSVYDASIDWTFRHAFLGTWKRSGARGEPHLSTPLAVRFEDEGESSDATATTSADEIVIVRNSKRRINFDLLRRTDLAILFFDSMELFEDELHDHGTSNLSVKFRVMDGCFLVLLRHFIRIDGRVAAVQDTRFFHEFSRHEGPDASQTPPVVVIERSTKTLALPALPNVGQHSAGGKAQQDFLSAQTAARRFTNPDEFISEMHEVSLECFHVVLRAAPEA